MQSATGPRARAASYMREQHFDLVFATPTSISGLRRVGVADDGRRELKPFVVHPAMGWAAMKGGLRIARHRRLQCGCKVG